MPRDLASASVVTSIASVAATTNIFIFTGTSGFAFIQVQPLLVSGVPSIGNGWSRARGLTNARVSLAVGIENVCGSLSRPIAVDLLLVLGRPFALCQGQVLGGQHKERCGRIRIAG